MDIVVLIFISCLVATYLAAFYGGRRATDGLDVHLQKLNKWQIGLSAAATGNSGFIVTGAVGLGYLYGIHWVLLPISWFLGDLIYWKYFPGRINKYAELTKSNTISQMLVYGLNGKLASVLSVLTATLVIVLLGVYTSAQWMAGKKFLSGAFELTDVNAIILFSSTIIIYTTFGGFRGSVFADITQAIIRIIGTILALLLVTEVALESPDSFRMNMEIAGEDFLSISGGLGIGYLLVFIFGWAAAAIGFGLGQPQIITRYMAGSSPEETRASWWIYIAFLQFTWIAMTIFGVVLRGTMPDISDPEAGLSLFVSTYAGVVVTGIVLADVYATIASASNSILISLAQVVRYDIIENLSNIKLTKVTTSLITLFVGIATIIISFYLPTSVFNVIVTAVSLLGASIGPAVLIKITGIKHSSGSLIATIIVGLLASYAWKLGPYGALMNEAVIGILSGILVNNIYFRFPKNH